VLPTTRCCNTAARATQPKPFPEDDAFLLGWLLGRGAKQQSQNDSNKLKLKQLDFCWRLLDPRRALLLDLYFSLPDLSACTSRLVRVVATEGDCCRNKLRLNGVHCAQGQDKNE